MGVITSHRECAERYGTLRFIAVIFTGLGALFLAAGSLLLAYCLYGLLSNSMVQPGEGTVPFGHRTVSVGAAPGNLAGVMSLLWSFALLTAGLQSLGMGALFRLFINLEENTRISAQCLEQLRSREDPRERNAGAFFRS